MDRGVVADEGAVKVMAGSKAGVMRVRPYFWPCLTVPPTPSVTNGWVSQWARNCGRLAGATADLAALNGDDGGGYEQRVGSSRGRFPLGVCQWATSLSMRWDVALNDNSVAETWISSTVPLQQGIKYPKTQARDWSFAVVTKAAGRYSREDVRARQVCHVPQALWAFSVQLIYKIK